ncbi:hypothetical protein MKEN_00604100 [Mycena kentingensis (nom. inval.)]|nr:hypothetical protein MKEN_00604100 [Mycena kentingensis (nom. inval.)]
MAQSVPDGQPLTNAGINAPYAPDFDFDIHTIPPPVIDDLSHELHFRNSENVEREKHNAASKSKTHAAKRHAAAKTGSFDIGEPFQPLYAFGDEEVQLLADDPEFAKTQNRHCSEEGFPRGRAMVPLSKGLRTAGGTLFPSPLKAAAAIRELPHLFILSDSSIASFAANPGSMPTKSISINGRTTAVFDLNAFIARSNVSPHDPSRFPNGVADVMSAMTNMERLAEYVAPKTGSPGAKLKNSLKAHFKFIQSLPSFGQHLGRWLGWSSILVTNLSWRAPRRYLPHRSLNRPPNVAHAPRLPVLTLSVRNRPAITAATETTTTAGVATEPARHRANVTAARARALVVATARADAAVVQAAIDAAAAQARTDTVAQAHAAARDMDGTLPATATTADTTTVMSGTTPDAVGKRATALATTAGTVVPFGPSTYSASYTRSLPAVLSAHTTLVYPDLSHSIRPRPRPTNFSVDDAEILNRVVTPYNADAFERALSDLNITDEFPQLVDNLRNGFPIGDLPELAFTSIIPNHSSVDKYPEAVQEYVEKELRLGRCSGPFTREEVERILCGPFRVSPLLVAASDQGPDLPPKLRVCRNLSKGDDDLDAINELIDKDLFPTSFDFASRVAEVIANAPAGTLACSFDFESFHRTVPVHPAHKPYIVFKVGDKFIIDHDHCFGLRSASSNAGQPGNATVRIWNIRIGDDGTVLKFEDDMAGFQFPLPDPAPFPSFRYTRDEFVGLVGDINAPWHPRKCGKRFEPQLIFIGFLWDIALRRISLPEHKRLKYFHRITTFLAKKLVSLKEIQQVHGTLVHITFVFRDGASRLPPISKSMHRYYRNEFKKWHIPDSARNALLWWRDRLNDPHAYRTLVPLPPMTDLRIFVDASTSWGVGVLIGNQWYAMRLRPDWRLGDTRDICWLEAAALEILFLFLIQLGHTNLHLLIHSDNYGAIGAHDKGRSTNPEINLCVRRSSESLFLHNIVPHLRYACPPPRPDVPDSATPYAPPPSAPHVPATHRFLAWQTPAGMAAQAKRSNIPPRAQALGMAEIASGLCKSTLNSYAAGPLRFTQWCDDNTIPEDERLPADPFLLCCFVASAAGKKSGSCASNWLNGLALWHHINFLPWYGDDSCVQKVVRSVEKKGAAFKRPLRGPVSVEHLRLLKTKLDLSAPRDAAYWALSLCAFWGCRRLGELTLITKNGFDAQHDLSRDADIRRSSQAGRRVVSIHIPWTKTTGTRGGTLILTSTDDDLCPVAALDNHLAVNSAPPANTPFFAFLENTSWKPVVKDAFLFFISRVFREGDLEQVFGHSFRIGGASFLLALGIDPDIVMKIGGWTSTCFLIYWRKLEKIIPLHLSRAWSITPDDFAKKHKLPNDISDLHEPSNIEYTMPFDQQNDLSFDGSAPLPNIAGVGRDIPSVGAEILDTLYFGDNDWDAHRGYHQLDNDRMLQRHYGFNKNSAVVEDNEEARITVISAKWAIGDRTCMEIAPGIRTFLSKVERKLHWRSIPSTLYDLSDAASLLNRERWPVVKTISQERDKYVIFPFPRQQESQEQPYVVLEDAAMVIQCMRWRFANTRALVSYLVLAGVEFFLGWRRETARMNAWRPRQDPFLGRRPADYKGSFTEYRAYKRLRDSFLLSDRGYLALLNGGVVARIARIVIENIEDKVMQPPDDAELNCGAKLVDMGDGHSLWMSVLTVEEMDLVCGLYVVDVDQNTRKHVSWFPPLAAFVGSSLYTGWWNASCENWFQEHLALLKTGKAKLKKNKEWKSQLRFNSKSVDIVLRYHDLAARYLSSSENVGRF